MAVLLGAPTAIGSARPDEAFEPRRLREDGLLDHLAALALDVRDLGDVEGLEPPWEAAPAGMRLRNVVVAIDQLKRLRGAVLAALLANGPPLLVLGGDALVLLGALAGMRDALGADPGAVLLDAEARFATAETTASGDLAGMVLALAVGIGAQPLLDALDAPLAAPVHTCLVGAVAGHVQAAAEAGVALAGDAGDVSVPEGPLLVAVDGSCLLPGALGVDRARQALLAAAVREDVAVVVFSGLSPDRGGAVQVAALAAAALR
jgi:arginase family enzyme